MLMRGEKNQTKIKSKRVVDIMGILFDQDIITRNYENEIFEEGKAKGK